MKTTIKYLLVFMFLTPIIAFSQSILKGTVSEQESGLPLPGVNVLLKGNLTLKKIFIAYKEITIVNDSQKKTCL